VAYQPTAVAMALTPAGSAGLGEQEFIWVIGETGPRQSLSLCQCWSPSGCSAERAAGSGRCGFGIDVLVQERKEQWLCAGSAAPACGAGLRVESKRRWVEDLCRGCWQWLHRCLLYADSAIDWAGGASAEGFGLRRLEAWALRLRRVSSSPLG